MAAESVQIFLVLSRDRFSGNVDYGDAYPSKERAEAKKADAEKAVHAIHEARRKASIEARKILTDWLTANQIPRDHLIWNYLPEEGEWPKAMIGLFEKWDQLRPGQALGLELPKLPEAVPFEPIERLEHLILELTYHPDAGESTP